MRSLRRRQAKEAVADGAEWTACWTTSRTTSWTSERIGRRAPSGGARCPLPSGSGGDALAIPCCSEFAGDGSPATMPRFPRMWRNWQTRKIQVLVGVKSRGGSIPLIRIQARRMSGLFAVGGLERASPAGGGFAARTGRGGGWKRGGSSDPSPYSILLRSLEVLPHCRNVGQSSVSYQLSSP